MTIEAEGRGKLLELPIKAHATVGEDTGQNFLFETANQYVPTIHDCAPPCNDQSGETENGRQP